MIAIRTSIFLLLLHTIVSHFAFGQESNNYYRALYLLEFQEDSTSSETREELMELLVGRGNKSLFRSCYIGQSDTIKYHPEAGLKQPSYPVSRNNYTILKNSQTQHIDFFEYFNQVNGELFRYTEGMENQDWELRPDTMWFGELRCQKAKLNYGNRMWEAWFCPEIPLSDGPYKFCGLPGLIVQVQDTTKSYTFSLVDIQKSNSLNLDLPHLNEHSVMDKLAFYEAKKEFNSNIFDRLVAAGTMNFHDPDAEARARKISQEVYKRRNNPIELYP